ncbi:FxsA family protein [Paenibacillus sp. SYP-B4298]|uniref:FxsA family protein n=1 Tax=Paenibacillus sp. SYP-B4298 TaxID=2996034 RepID=UPI0022DD6436|nr:FxsA family protein [Paenibacillus sp. SYP-B4298]
MSRRNYWPLLLLIAAPALELWGIMKVSSWIGGGAALLLMLLTAAVGVYWARKEGLRVLLEAQRQMQSGQIPGQMMIDGLCVLLGGVLLIIPGFFSDLIGISLIFPWTRPYYRKLILGWIEARMRNGSITIRR